MKRILLLFSLAMISTASVFATDHATYRRALVDLRAARWYIISGTGENKPNGMEAGAVRFIDDAIKAINGAKVTDEKANDDHGSAEDIHGRLARLNKAIDLLRKVRNDVKRGEDADFGNHLQEKVFANVDQAILDVQKAIRNG